MKFQNQLLKYAILSCLFFTTHQSIIASSNEPTTLKSEIENLQESTNPLLVLVLMVRNEEHVIVPTIKTYVESGITNILVYDTGSKDTTVSTTETYFKDANLKNAYVVQEYHDPATFDFALARNRGMDVAQEKFPNATFILFPDAEWYLENGSELLKFCKEHKDDIAAPYYLMKIGNKFSNFDTGRLFRCASNVRFEGNIHEVPNRISFAKVPPHIRFELKNSARGIEQSRARWKRDLVKLQKRHAENPENPRDAFYLAQTYDCLGMIEEAQKMYAIRAAMPGWDEENYLAKYRQGCMTEAIEARDEKTDYKMAIEHFSTAHAMRPQRVEPLVRLGQIFWKLQNFTLCFAIAQMAINKEKPLYEALPLEDYLYDYERWELMSKAAWYVGEYKLGEIASKKVLEYAPELANSQYQKNLILYLQAQGIATT